MDTTAPNSTLRDAVESAVAENWFGMLATTSTENRPHVAGVLYALVGRDLYVNTDETSRKARNIADTGRAAVCIPINPQVSEGAPDVPPLTASFQGTAELLPNDHPQIAELVASGQLAAITSHGELERPGTCMVKITPSGRIVTYGIGVSEDEMAADPLNAFGSVAW
jgi:nitroimidazol reductase NimA-like FMN-containing flavoprotein (pyridoxamine 5'-phosphate oxidase superfamily)